MSINSRIYKVKLYRSGVYIPIPLIQTVSKSNDINKTLRRIKSHFTIVTIINRIYRKTINQSKILNISDTQYIRVPRFGAFEIFNDNNLNKKLQLQNLKIENNINYNTSNDIILTKNFRLKPNQNVICDYIMNNNFNTTARKNGESGLILKLDTGLGKSYIAMNLIYILKKRTLIIAPTTNILYDWANKIKLAFPGVKLGYQYGKEKILGDIVIGITPSLLMDEIKCKKYETKEIVTYCPIDYFNQFDFIVYDEVDMYCSTTFSNLFRKAQGNYMLGLSATPEERIDKFHTIAKWWVGPILDVNNIPNYNNQEIVFSGEINIIRYNGPEKYTKRLIRDTGEVDYANTINRLADDVYRNMLIMNELKKLLQDNHNIFIFADRRDYLIYLRELLITEKIHTVLLDNNTSKAQAVMGGIKYDKLNEAEKQAHVILTTYQFYGVGKSLPKMTAIILATPRRRKGKQFIGRITRMGGDDLKKRVIIDIVDNKTFLRYQLNDRKKVYEITKFPVTEHIIEYTDITVPEITVSDLTVSDIA